MNPTLQFSLLEAALVTASPLDAVGVLAHWRSLLIGFRFNLDREAGRNRSMIAAMISGEGFEAEIPSLFEGTVIGTLAAGLSFEPALSVGAVEDGRGVDDASVEWRYVGHV